MYTRKVSMECYLNDQQSFIIKLHLIRETDRKILNGIGTHDFYCIE